jgi:predicted nucleic acid-binding protein
MPKNYLLDACALIAYLGNENGNDIVEKLIEQAKRKEIIVCINAANLIEVYYNRVRKMGPDMANAIIQGIYKDFPITIIDKLTPDIVREAAYLKAGGGMSFADTILLATARCTGATVVTCDHAEFKPVEQRENIPFLWIRPPLNA